MTTKNDRFYRKSDRKALIVLLVAAIGAVLAVYWAGDRGGSDGDGHATDAAADSAAMADESGETLKNRPFHRGVEPTYETGGPYYYAGEPQGELFFFDPNTADSTALLRLGLRPWQVRNIYKYRARGGVYHEPGDFARLYGLTVKEYRRLKPYIRISPDYRLASTLPEAARAGRDTLKYPVKLKEGETIVLNTADTAMLKRVPGIGSGYARAIVAYGERLGGYVSVSQLDEIEDFPQDAKPFFTISDPHPAKLNVNRLTAAQLRRHPYITYHQAKAITDYRRLHGSLRSLNDLSLHRDFTAEAIKRLEPYVEF